MKLSKPSEMDEEPSSKENDAMELENVMIETEYGEMSVLDAVVQNSETLDNPEDFGIASAEAVTELRETVEQQEKMIGELIETVEIMAMAVENDYTFKHAYERWVDVGNETGVDWEEDAYGFKEARYE